MARTPDVVSTAECKEQMTVAFGEVYRQLNLLKKDVADYKIITEALDKQIQVLKEKPIRIDKY